MRIKGMFKSIESISLGVTTDPADSKETIDESPQESLMRLIFTSGKRSHLSHYKFTWQPFRARVQQAGSEAPQPDDGPSAARTALLQLRILLRVG